MTESTLVAGIDPALPVWYSALHTIAPSHHPIDIHVLSYLFSCPILLIDCLMFDFLKPDHQVFASNARLRLSFMLYLVIVYSSWVGLFWVRNCYCAGSYVKAYFAKLRTLGCGLPCNAGIVL